MAKAIGARVVTTAGSDEKAEEARWLRANLAINYKTEDVDAQIRHFAPNGVDVWWETLRDARLRPDDPMMAKRGRMT